jgi:hypothetical protein
MDDVKDDVFRLNSLRLIENKTIEQQKEFIKLKFNDDDKIFGGFVNFFQQLIIYCLVYFPIIYILTSILKLELKFFNTLVYCILISMVIRYILFKLDIVSSSGWEFIYLDKNRLKKKGEMNDIDSEIGTKSP